MVGKLKGLRQTTLGILHDQEIFTIEELLSNDEDINGVSEKLMCSLLTQSASAHGQEAPANLNLDHKRHENPYLSKYGVEWEKEIAKVSMMSSYVCITYKVTHIYEKKCRSDEKYTIQGHLAVLS